MDDLIYYELHIMIQNNSIELAHIWKTNSFNCNLIQVFLDVNLPEKVLFCRFCYNLFAILSPSLSLYSQVTVLGRKIESSRNNRITQGKKEQCNPLLYNYIVFRNYRYVWNPVNSIFNGWTDFWDYYHFLVWRIPITIKFSQFSFTISWAFNI